MPTIQAKPVTITFDSTLSPLGLRCLATRLRDISEDTSASHALVLRSMADGLVSEAEAVEALEAPSAIFAPIPGCPLLR